MYVADTWNHRIQKFSATGEFIKMWGYFGQAETPEAFWGPRDVAIDTMGRVFVTDTGNKRIVVFTKNGEFLFEFGEAGLLPGQFDEPIGMAFDGQNYLYVADTWNQRVQVFSPIVDNNYLSLFSWDIAGWYGESLDNKPFLAVDKNDNIYVTDPEGYRILVFTSEGEFVYYWGTYSTGENGFGLISGVAADSQNGIWVSDAGNNRILHFSP